MGDLIRGWFGCFLFPVFVCILFSSPSAAQLSPSESRILYQIQEQLEFPQVLQGWNNWTSFCYLPPIPSLVILCSDNRVTELTIVGNKSSQIGKPTSGNSFSVSENSLSDGFSIDSFFTVLTKLSNLRVLTLVSLGLWGPLPSKISRLNSLQVLNVSSNFISGGIPNSILKFENLTSLVLADNLFNGSVPDLKGLNSLQELDLGGNYLGPCFPSLGYNLVFITLRNNSLRFGIPQEFTGFGQLEKLDVSFNNLVGPFPSSLLSLPSIQYLDLARNQFSGEISSNASCGVNLGFVDVSYNLLIGKLPFCIGSNSTNRTVLSSWNCLYNGSSKYQHPYSFCQKEALAVQPQVGANHGHGSTVKLGVVLGIIGAIVGIVGAIGLLILVVYRRAEPRKVEERGSSSFTFDKISISPPPNVDPRIRPQRMMTAALGLPPYRTFTLEEMEDATNNFDSSNLVGEGSHGQLYRGWLRDGSLVLVKCLKIRKKYSAQTLQQHMEVISKLRHRHLASVLGHCTVPYLDHTNSATTIFVVIEHVSNGSLRDHLMDWRKKEVLKWPHRMAITLGIAKGIQFLHSRLQQGIFGNGLKIESVLLDESLTAKVGNYNISLPLTEGFDGSSNGQGASKRLMRAANPEKDDVYQFGIVLLQLITGKLVASEDEANELKNEIEISLADAPARLRDAADPSIRGTFAYESLKTAVQIAISCLGKEPSERPSMEDVLWHLQYSVQVQEGWTSSGNLSGNLNTKQ